MSKRITELGEFGLIELISKNIGVPRVAVAGIGDDTAVVPFNKDKYQLLTTDMLIEGRHFKASADYKLVGRKAVNCNVSDIAAMGGIPRFALISLGVAKNSSVDRVKDLYQGMKRACRRENIEIIGGDMVESRRLVINVAMTGVVRKKHLVLRSSAGKDDVIFVSGPLGQSLSSGKHLTFKPRLKESSYLVREFNPTSMIDISDGLASDLGHILKASGKGAILYSADIPLTKGATLRDALNDGEDYELLFTLRPEEAQRLVKCKRPFKFTAIGRVCSGKEGFKLEISGRTRRLKNIGYDHFK